MLPEFNYKIIYPRNLGYPPYLDIFKYLNKFKFLYGYVMFKKIYFPKILLNYLAGMMDLFYKNRFIFGKNTFFKIF